LLIFEVLGCFGCYKFDYIALELQELLGPFKTTLNLIASGSKPAGQTSEILALPVAIPIFFDDSRHSRGRIPQPI